MTPRIAAAFLTLLLAVPAAGQGPLTASMDRTVERRASQALERDVRAYLAAHGFNARTIVMDMLRKGPTQSGIAFPKYYLWVRATDAARHRVEGAIRVAAIDRERFDVTDFTSAAAIRVDPTSLAVIYPAAIIPAIRSRAARR